MPITLRQGFSASGYFNGIVQEMPEINLRGHGRDFFGTILDRAGQPDIEVLA